MAEESGAPGKRTANGGRSTEAPEGAGEAAVAEAEAAEDPGFRRTGRAFAELAGALRQDLGVASNRVARQAKIRARRFRQQMREADTSRLRANLSGIPAFVRSGSAKFRERVAAWRRARTASPHPPNRGIGRTLLRGAMAALALCLVAVALLFYWALRDVPWQEIAEGSLEPVVVLQTADGAPLVSQGPMRGAYATHADFPDHLVNAVLAIEDRRFYEHSGVDLRGIARAAFRNVRAGEVVQGGSTITQQLIKILYLESDRTFKRKLQEVVIALWLESTLGKDEILTRYLNNVYLGAGATGMPAAARIYFDKEVRELDLTESALLAGLIRAPSQLNPIENPEGARARTSLVLDAMVASGTLAAERAAEAKQQFAELNPTDPAERSGSWFADWVIDEAREIAGPFRGTISVRTTLMPRLQQIADRLVAEALEAHGEESGVGQAALVAMTPDGAVVAMVGGRDYDDSEFNRAADAMRQPGSTFKLFVYYAALKEGFDPRDRVDDEPVEIDGWTPENFGGDYHGRVTIAEAFARSYNAAAVNLAMEVGIGKVAATARELGIDAELTESPSLALGASEVSLIDLTGAYASVRAGAAPVEPWGIVSFQASGQPRSFRVGPSEPPKENISEIAATMIGLLKLVVDGGTGQAAQLDGFAAGKTGTSQNFRDAWFVGFTEPLVAGVWVGNDDDTPTNEVTGGKLPATIWKSFMSEALAALNGEPGGEEAPVTAATGEEAETVACNVRTCSRAYRSFRASDCTFQPYRGPRRLCEK